MFYTWAVTIFSVGELTGSLISPVVYKFLPNRFSFLIGTMFSPLGFVLYSFAPSAWFILIARLFIGINCDISIAVASAYMSETSVIVYQREKKQQSSEAGGSRKTSTENPLRDKLFSLLTFSATSGPLLVLGKKRCMGCRYSCCNMFFLYTCTCACSFR